jgi:hypothetical protein
MAGFRDLFCRKEGFAHVSRYVTGLILSPNKTLQGIDNLQVWDRDTPSRRAMHEAVFEAAWDSQALIQQASLGQRVTAWGSIHFNRAARRLRRARIPLTIDKKMAFD